MIHRFSSRTGNLGEAFFKNALKDATSYGRIAGYFSSSIIEMTGEHIEQMQGKVRIICNSQLQADDVRYIKNQPQVRRLCISRAIFAVGWTAVKKQRLYQNHAASQDMQFHVCRAFNSQWYSEQLGNGRG